MESFQALVPLAAAAAFALAATYGAVRDLISFEIPNWVPIAVAASFLVAAPAAGWAWGAVAENAGTGLAVLAVGFLLFARGYCGGGDAKLLAAASVWIGWHGLAQFILVVTLLGGVLALLILLLRRIPLPVAVAEAPAVRRLRDAESGVPYGVAIAVAALLLLPRLPILEGLI